MELFVLLLLFFGPGFLWLCFKIRSLHSSIGNNPNTLLEARTWILNSTSKANSCQLQIFYPRFKLCVIFFLPPLKIQ